MTVCCERNGWRWTDNEARAKLVLKDLGPTFRLPNPVEFIFQDNFVTTVPAGSIYACEKSVNALYRQMPVTVGSWASLSGSSEWAKRKIKMYYDQTQNKFKVGYSNGKFVHFDQARERVFANDYATILFDRARLALTVLLGLKKSDFQEAAKSGLLIGENYSDRFQLATAVAEVVPGTFMRLFDPRARVDQHYLLPNNPVDPSMKIDLAQLHSIMNPVAVVFARSTNLYY